MPGNTFLTVRLEQIIASDQPVGCRGETQQGTVWKPYALRGLAALAGPLKNTVAGKAGVDKLVRAAYAHHAEALGLHRPLYSLGHFAWS